GRVVVQVLDDGAMRFVRPDGQSFESHAPGGPRQVDWMQLVAVHQARQIHVTPRTAVTRWQGEGLDYGLAVDGLLQRASCASNAHQANDVFRGNAASNPVAPGR
ncbi:MAG: hypothetical protein ACREVZ_11450, partial [Burkholderiales bacterium]